MIKAARSDLYAISCELSKRTFLETDTNLIKSKLRKASSSQNGTKKQGSLDISGTEKS